MQNNLTYEQLANVFRAVYTDDSKNPDNQRENFVLRLCGDHKAIYETAENIWDKMTYIYQDNIPDKEKTNYIQDIKANLCALNEFLQSRFLINKKFLKYEDLLLLLVAINNQGYTKTEGSKSQFVSILSKNNQHLFEVVEDLWFTVINIRDEVIAPAERNKYITSVNSKLDSIDKFLYNQKDLNLKQGKNFCEMIIQQNNFQKSDIGMKP